MCDYCYDDYMESGDDYYESTGGYAGGEREEETTIT